MKIKRIYEECVCVLDLYLNRNNDQVTFEDALSLYRGGSREVSFLRAKFYFYISEQMKIFNYLVLN